MSKVLVVDDEPSICWAFQQFLAEDGHEVGVAGSAEEALPMAEAFLPDAVVLDVRLPGMNGISALGPLRKSIGQAPVIIVTAFGDLETAVRAVEAGAFDYLVKPFDLETARAAVNRALDSAGGKRSAAEPRIKDNVDDESLIGSSPPMQEVFKRIALVAATDVPVLITGESGTGKELVARAIHRHSTRRSGPFMPVCLPALSPGVVEAELFGHAKGAFTGALGERKGLLELASGGTVLLDEIGEVDLALQVKLLRTIERKEVTPVGEAKPRSADFRVVAATNRDLAERISADAFREDLYFRLSAFPIHVPPLRERGADVLALAERFLARFSISSGVHPLMRSEFSSELLRRKWWGNVRELKNAVEHAAILARGGRLLPEHLPEPLAPLSRSPAGQPLEDRIAQLVAQWTEAEAGKLEDKDQGELYEKLLAAVEPVLLRTILDQKNQNRAAAALALGLHRATLRQKLRRYEIE